MFGSPLVCKQQLDTKNKKHPLSESDLTWLGSMVSVIAALVPTVGLTAASNGVAAAPVFSATSTRRPASAIVPDAASSIGAAPLAPTASMPWMSTRSMTISVILLAPFA